MNNIGSTAGPSTVQRQHLTAAASEPTVERIRDALRDVIDAYRGVNIIDLGLVHRIEIADRIVTITMTMTAPDCPAQGHILSGMRERLMMIPGVGGVDIKLVREQRRPSQKNPAQPAPAAASRNAHRD
jgi:metal-sulfur cluster biosynthetic enzyme